MHDLEPQGADIRALLSRMAYEAPLEPVDLPGAVGRARRRIALVWVSTLLAVALVIGGAALAWERAEEAYIPRPAEPGPTFTEGDLPAMVLATKLDVTRATGGQPLAHRLQAFRPREVTPGFLSGHFSLSAAGLSDAGMQTGYIGWFATPRFEKVPGGTSLISVVLLFPDAVAADDGLGVIYADGEEDFSIFRTTPTAGLGDEGWFADGRMWSTPRLAIVWRSGNAVFFLASEGHFTPDEFRRLAEDLDRRAGSVA